MRITCRCPSCGAGYQVDEQFVGRKAKCPKSAAAIVVAAATASPTAPAARPVKSAGATTAPQQPRRRLRRSRPARHSGEGQAGGQEKLPVAAKSKPAAAKPKPVADFADLAELDDNPLAFAWDAESPRKPAAAVGNNAKKVPGLAGIPVDLRGRPWGRRNRVQRRSPPTKAPCCWPWGTLGGVVVLTVCIAVAVMVMQKRPATGTTAASSQAVAATWKKPPPKRPPSSAHGAAVAGVGAGRRRHHRRRRHRGRAGQRRRESEPGGAKGVAQDSSDAAGLSADRVLPHGERRGAAVRFPSTGRPCPAAFDDWLQDFAEAKRLAAKGNKWVLILFDASDSPAPRTAKRTGGRSSRGPSSAIRWKRITSSFISTTRNTGAKANVKDAKQNLRVGKELAWLLSTILLLNKEGGPVGVHEGFQTCDLRNFLEMLGKSREPRTGSPRWRRREFDPPPRERRRERGDQQALEPVG